MYSCFLIVALNRAADGSTGVGGQGPGAWVSFPPQNQSAAPAEETQVQPGLSLNWENDLLELAFLGKAWRQLCTP